MALYISVALIAFQNIFALAAGGNKRADQFNINVFEKFEKVPEKIHLSTIVNNPSSLSYRKGTSLDYDNCDGRITLVPPELTFITKYNFYHKYLHAYGLPIISSREVSDEALRRACHIIKFMFADRKDVRDSMFRNFGRFGVIAINEETTTIPEFSHLSDWWNKRARGLGGVLGRPISTGGEENLLCLRQDRYYGDDIFFHEASHGVAEVAIKGGGIPGFYNRILWAYNNAKKSGKWQNTYALTDSREYFAEGMQSFFENHPDSPTPNGVHNYVNTRAELKAYDRALYDLIKEAYPCMNQYKMCTNNQTNFRVNCNGNSTQPPPTHPKLINSLAPTLYFNEKDTPSLNIVVSGIPRPTVTWIFKDHILPGSYAHNNNYEYTYKVIMPFLLRQYCGYNMDYSISGWNNSVIEKTSTVFVNFTLDKPVVTVTPKTEKSIRVSWKQPDYGLCSANYTVHVLDESQKVLKSIQATKFFVDITFPKDGMGKATMVKVIASYKGQRSSSEKYVTSFSTKPPTTIKKEVLEGSTPIISGVVAGVTLPIIIIVVIVIYLKKKNEKKSRSSIGSAQGADNSCKDIPIDKCAGARENSYSTGSSKPPSRENNPDQILYAEHGAGGEMTNVEPALGQFNYAVVIGDDEGYPACSPTSDTMSSPTHAAINPERFKRHSLPLPRDDNEGVII